jgi:putative tricarboxylic transport membrane protein
MSARLSGVLAGLVFLLIGSGLIYLSPRLAGGLGLSAAEPGPGLFPMLVGAMMVVAAAAHLVQTVAQAAEEGESEHRAPRDIVLLVITIAAYILLLPRAGFFIAAFLLLLGCLSIYDMPGWWRRIATSVVATLVSYGVFTLGLNVNMPSPTWFN